MSAGHKRKREHDQDWIEFLREYELDDKADALQAEGVGSSRDLFAMSESDAKELRKELKLRWRFLEMWKVVQEREKSEREKTQKAEREAAAFQSTIDDLQQRADVAALVRGMRTYAAHSGVQEKVCVALLNLTPSLEGDKY